jgi:hypothetical protein
MSRSAAMSGSGRETSESFWPSFSVAADETLDGSSMDENENPSDPSVVAPVSTALLDPLLCLSASGKAQSLAGVAVTTTHDAGSLVSDGPAATNVTPLPEGVPQRSDASEPESKTNTTKTAVARQAKKGAGKTTHPDADAAAASSSKTVADVMPPDKSNLAESTSTMTLAKPVKKRVKRKRKPLISRPSAANTSSLDAALVAKKQKRNLQLASLSAGGGPESTTATKQQPITDTSSHSLDAGVPVKKKGRHRKGLVNLSLEPGCTPTANSAEPDETATGHEAADDAKECDTGPVVEADDFEPEAPASAEEELDVAAADEQRPDVDDQDDDDDQEVDDDQASHRAGVIKRPAAVSSFWSAVSSFGRSSTAAATKTNSKKRRKGRSSSKACGQRNDKVTSSVQTATTTSSSTSLDAGGGFDNREPDFTPVADGVEPDETATGHEAADDAKECDTGPVVEADDFEPEAPVCAEEEHDVASADEQPPDVDDQDDDDDQEVNDDQASHRAGVIKRPAAASSFGRGKCRSSTAAATKTNTKKRRKGRSSSKACGQRNDKVAGSVETITATSSSSTSLDAGTGLDNCEPDSTPVADGAEPDDNATGHEAAGGEEECEAGSVVDEGDDLEEPEAPAGTEEEHVAAADEQPDVDNDRDDDEEVDDDEDEARIIRRPAAASSFGCGRCRLSAVGCATCRRPGYRSRRGSQQ